MPTLSGHGTPGNDAFGQCHIGTLIYLSAIGLAIYFSQKRFSA